MIKKDWDDLSLGEKGDWYFHHNDSYITIRYGESKMDVVSIPINNGEVKGQAWGWNGDKDKPTITPSIAIRGKEGEPDIWHGFLIDGVIKDA